MGRYIVRQTVTAGNVPAVHTSQSVGFDGGVFTAEQLAWLDLLRHQLAADTQRTRRLRRK